jgi:recombination protein RecA
MPNSKLDILIAEINKKYGENVISRYGSFERPNGVNFTPSGSIFLDYCIGKGFPTGKIVELYGVPSSGKSLISQLTVGEAQKRGGECIWIDAENSFDPGFAEKLGVDIKKLVISQSSIGEPTLELIKKLLSVNPAIIVVDSVAAMVPIMDMEKPLEDAVVAPRARLMSRGLAQINALNRTTLIIFINQLRTDIGGYSPTGTASTTTGGRALGHFASVRVEVKRGEWIEEEKVKLGHVVKFRVVKNRVGPPMREGYFKFYYDGKIDRIDEIVSLGLMSKKLDTSGSWIQFDGKKWQGRDSFTEAVKKDTELFTKLKESIFS